MINISITLSNDAREFASTLYKAFTSCTVGSTTLVLRESISTFHNYKYRDPHMENPIDTLVRFIEAHPFILELEIDCAIDKIDYEKLCSIKHLRKIQTAGVYEQETYDLGEEGLLVGREVPTAHNDYAFTVRFPSISFLFSSVLGKLGLQPQEIREREDEDGVIIEVSPSGPAPTPQGTALNVRNWFKQ